MRTETAYTPDEKPQLTYSLTQTESGEEQLIVFEVGTATTIPVLHDNPNYAEIREGVLSGEWGIEEVKAKVDMTDAVARSFRSITDRVKVSGSRVYFDGDEIHNSLTEHIVRCLEARLGNYKPLVKFLENLAQNPNEHSRNQLYDWLTRHDFTITADGEFIAYKGVMLDENGDYVSINTGPAIVNGNPVDGHVPNPLGGVIEIARSKVEFNPSVGCSSGLHAGAYEYAHSFACGALLKVKINPRDVVSVPTDSDWQKVRVCRYVVLEQIDAPDTRPVEVDDDLNCGCGCDCECDRDCDYDHCAECGEELRDHWDYCAGCGTEL